MYCHFEGTCCREALPCKLGVLPFGAATATPTTAAAARAPRIRPLWFLPAGAGEGRLLKACAASIVFNSPSQLLLCEIQSLERQGVLRPDFQHD